VAKADKLSHQDKVFLVGCVKTMLLDESEIEMAEIDLQELELQDMERLFGRLGLPDYESYMNEFDEEVRTRESFWAAAAKISNPRARDLILKSVYELMRESGAPSESQQRLFDELRTLWATH
jgi:hypothetical protein